MKLPELDEVQTFRCYSDHFTPFVENYCKRCEVCDRYFFHLTSAYGLPCCESCAVLFRYRVIRINEKDKRTPSCPREAETRIWSKLFYNARKGKKASVHNHRKSDIS